MEQNGDNGWYKGIVDVIISYETKEENDITMKYGVEGEYTLAEKQTKEKQVQFTIAAEGISNIKAYTIDNERNETSTEAKVEVKIDTVPPEKPEIKIIKGAMGETGWYETDVVLEITGSEDVHRIRYVVTGTTNITKTINGNTATLVISNDGKSKIIAYALDEAGNISEPTEELEISKDANAPTVKLTATNFIGNYMYVLVRVEENGSGIYSYQFMYRPSGQEEYIQDGEIIISSEKTYSYKYASLTAGQQYDLMVYVTDLAGNVGSGTAKSKIEVVAKIGDVVTYSGKGGSSSYPLPQIYTGVATTSLAREGLMEWRIFNL